MLSSVLKSKKAVKVNIEIMRAFVRLKKLEIDNHLIRERLRDLEHKVGHHDSDIHSIFDVLERITKIEEKPKPKIGFHHEAD